MADPYVGEIKIAGFTFAPVGYAFCNGQLLSIQQNTALYAVLGTTYGGNGTTNFALPDMQARAPMHWGSGSGLSPRQIGEQDGSANITLLTRQMPNHGHALNAGTATPPNAAQNTATPTTQAMFGTSNPNQVYSDVATPPVGFAPAAIGIAGGSQPHENRQPLLALNFIIALQGIFPSRN